MCLGLTKQVTEELKAHRQPCAESLFLTFACKLKEVVGLATRHNARALAFRIDLRRVAAAGASESSSMFYVRRSRMLYVGIHAYI